jgi:acyl-CoA thioester hydrolase
MTSKPVAKLPDPTTFGAAREPLSVQLQVPFHDCDPLFVVWHGRYFQYLEVARSALFARHALDVEDVRALQHRMYVIDVRCRYLYPLTYNDQLRVTARFTALRPHLRIAYEVFNISAQRKSARALTVMATTDVNGQLLAETPQAVMERLLALRSETHGD